MRRRRAIKSLDSTPIEDDAELPELNGRLDWTSYLLGRIPTLVAIVGAFFAPLFAVNAFARQKAVATGFATLIGLAVFLHFVVSQGCLVASFRFQGGVLRYKRCGRRWRSVDAAEIAAVDDEAKRNSGATVWLHDGGTIYFPFEALPNSVELVAAIRELKRGGDAVRGRLNRQGVAFVLILQALIVGVLSAVSLVALMCLTVFANPRGVVGFPLAFLGSGVVLLALSGAGFYFGVVQYWLGLVHSFSWDGQVLRYRTLWSRFERERYFDEIESVETRGRDSSRGESGVAWLLRFRDGERIKFPSDTLPNARLLGAALKREIDRRRYSETACTTLVGRDHPLWNRVQPQLRPGEQVYWLGRPAIGKLWNEMAGEMAAGLILAGMGSAFATAAVSVRGDLAAVWFLGLLGLVFLALGFYCLAAPWRYRRLLDGAVYAVTSQRVLILHGVEWGKRSFLRGRDVDVETFERNQVQRVEVVGPRRDLVFGGYWKRGCKRSYRLNFGFLAPDDPEGAEAAVRALAFSESWSP